MRAPLRATLQKFAELGGKVIDTAPGYGASEEVLGQLLAELGIASQLFMATKVDREGRGDDACVACDGHVTPVPLEFVSSRLGEADGLTIGLGLAPGEPSVIPPAAPADDE